MTKAWIAQHTGIVSEEKVHKALAYQAEYPHPASIALYERTVSENELKRIWAEVYGEQAKGSIDDKKAASDRDSRVVAARERIAQARLDLDAHERRIESAKSLISIFQTESANTRNIGNLR